MRQNGTRGGWQAPWMESVAARRSLRVFEHLAATSGNAATVPPRLLLYDATPFPNLRCLLSSWFI
ncbi:hypothetical protein Hdeb2414_s0004g00148441 [Helianthus debilis subsp. tardiflorus]